MRVLVVGQVFPWPSTAGARMRLANVVAALGEVAEVEVFVLADPDRDEPCELPPGSPVARAQTVPRPRAAGGISTRLRWWTGGRAPLELSLLGGVEEARDRFRRWLAPPYDLVWYHQLATYATLGPVPGVATVVDLDDLEDHKRRARLAAEAGDAGGRAGVVAWARRAAAGAQATTNTRRWSRLQAEVAAAVDVVAVCSELDRRRLGVDNCAVVPNGYDAPERPLGRAAVASPPTVLFTGQLRRPPNVDAARQLVERVAPLLRARVRDLRLRLVGLADGRVAGLADPPRVTVTGWVPDLAGELARADLVAVPLRYGGGTRIKVIEAFAHRIPVVSTTTGAEGLEVEHGRHLLLADTPEAFAAACAELLTDPAARAALVAEAHRLFLERYQWRDIRAVVSALATATATAPTRTGRTSPPGRGEQRARFGTGGEGR